VTATTILANPTTSRITRQALPQYALLGMQAEGLVQVVGQANEATTARGLFHLVFTILHELNLIGLKNKKVIYNILFKAASQTILELSNNTKHMGADTGLVIVLYTWGQNMMEHPICIALCPMVGGTSIMGTGHI
jgi:hypothetical protein